MSQYPEYPPRRDEYFSEQGPIPSSFPNNPHPSAEEAFIGEPEGQSKLGIAAIISFCAAILFFIAMIVCAILAPSTGANLVAIDYVGIASMLLGGICNFLGLILAIAGFFDRKQKKATVWVGLLLNVIPCMLLGAITLTATVIVMMTDG